MTLSLIILITLVLELSLLALHLINKSDRPTATNYKDVPVNKRPRMLHDSNDVYGQNFYR